MIHPINPEDLRQVRALEKHLPFLLEYLRAHENDSVREMARAIETVKGLPLCAQQVAGLVPLVEGRIEQMDAENAGAVAAAVREEIAAARVKVAALLEHEEAVECGIRRYADLIGFIGYVLSHQGEFTALLLELAADVTRASRGGTAGAVQAP